MVKVCVSSITGGMFLLALDMVSLLSVSEFPPVASPLYYTRKEQHPCITKFAAIGDSASSPLSLFRGTYRTEPGAKTAGDCIPCPGGYHCPELGTVAPQACGAGSFSVSGSCFMLVAGQHKN